MSVPRIRPSPRAQRLLAIGLGGVALATTVAAVVAVGLSGGSAWRETGDVLAYPLLAVIGALIVLRRDGHTVGWVMLAGGLTFAVMEAGEGYVILSLARGGLPGDVWAAWVASWVFSPAWTFTFLWLPMLYPDGRLASRRWRPLAWLGVLVTLQAVPAALVPDLVPLDDERVFAANPIGIDGAEALLEGLVDGAAMLTVFLWLAAIVMQVQRYRHAGTVERLQLRWFVWAVAVVIGTILATISPALSEWVERVPSGFVFGAIPVSVGLAVTRYRLYEIDRIISRTLSYAVIVTLLGSLYVVGVVGFGALLRPLAPESDLAVAGSTLLVAALVRPVRSRVRSTVDRRFDRRRYDAAATVATFASRLRDELHLGQISSELAGTTVRAVQPISLSIWLARPEPDP